MKDYIELIKDKDQLLLVRGFFIVLLPVFFPFIVVAWIFDLIFNNK